SVKIIGPRLGDDIHDAARCAPILSVEVVGDDAELLDGILRNEQADGSIKDVRVFRAIQEDFGARSALAVDGKADAPICKVLTGTGDLRIGATYRPVAGAYVPGQRDEVVRIAREARQIRDLLGCDDLRNLLRLRVDFRSRS